MPDPVATAPFLRLADILAELAGAGVRATPLNIIAHATDRGLSDAELGAIIRELAEAPGSA